jgi:c-di-GMP-binding flagellar brake protein YcgR
MDVPDSPSLRAETSDISASGLCLVSELPFALAAPVEIFLKMPEEVMGGPAKQWCCRGKVVRVASTDPQRRARIVGVQFQYYEVLPEEGEQLESALAHSAMPWRHL